MLRIRDTTLREGIQVPGMDLSIQEKAYVAGQLYSAGIREIEIGLPNDIESCGDISRFIHDNCPMKTSGIVQVDRDNFREVIRQSTGIFNVVDLTTHRLDESNLVFYLGRLQEAIDIAQDNGVAYGIAVMNATETPIDLLKKVSELAKDKFVYYDSKGIASSLQIYDRIKEVGSISSFFHGHNDYGQVLANGLAAIEAGAIGLDASILGMGARAGNLPLEELALALEKQYSYAILNLDVIRKLVSFFQQEKKFSRDLIAPFFGDLILTETSVAHMVNPDAFRPFPAEILYAFCLPVSYREFIETVGTYSPETERRLREATLKTGTPFPKGLKKQEVIQIIRGE